MIFFDVLHYVAFVRSRYDYYTPMSIPKYQSSSISPGLQIPPVCTSLLMGIIVYTRQMFTGCTIGDIDRIEYVSISARVLLSRTF